MYAFALVNLSHGVDGLPNVVAQYSETSVNIMIMYVTEIIVSSKHIDQNIELRVLYTHPLQASTMSALSAAAVP